MFQTQYFGGEQRLDLGGSSTSIMLAAEVTPKEALAAELLLTAMGKSKIKSDIFRRLVFFIYMRLKMLRLFGYSKLRLLLGNAEL